MSVIKIYFVYTVVTFYLFISQANVCFHFLKALTVFSKYCDP